MAYNDPHSFQLIPLEVKDSFIASKGLYRITIGIEIELTSTI